jgi:hypothetical protein
VVNRFAVCCFGNVSLKACMKVYSFVELEKLVPCGNMLSNDVIEYVGRALFMECLSEKQIQS